MQRLGQRLGPRRERVTRTSQSKEDLELARIVKNVQYGRKSAEIPRPAINCDESFEDNMVSWHQDTTRATTIGDWSQEKRPPAVDRNCQLQSC